LFSIDKGQTETCPLNYLSTNFPSLNSPKNYEAGEKYLLQSQGFKYVYRTAGPDEFYNLRTDPYEINNLIT
jgi:hypothetical protein